MGETDIDPDVVDLDDVAAALAVSRRQGGARGEVFVEHRDNRTTQFVGGMVEVRIDRHLGAALRVGRAGHERQAPTSLLSGEGPTTTAEIAAATIYGVLGGQTTGLTEHPARRVNQAHRDSDVGDAAARIDLVRRVAAGARESVRAIYSLTVTLVEVDQDMLAATADGASPGSHRARRRLLRDPAVPATQAPCRRHGAAASTGQPKTRSFTVPTAPQPLRDHRTRGAR